MYPYIRKYYSELNGKTALRTIKLYQNTRQIPVLVTYKSVYARVLNLLNLVVNLVFKSGYRDHGRDHSSANRTVACTHYRVSYCVRSSSVLEHLYTS